MGFLLHLEQIISSMPIATIANSGKPIVATNHKTGLQQERPENYQP
jgi:hypothetical protein